MLTDNFSGSFVDHLHQYVGETVTIFTTSGGQSGCGFTGVLLFVNHCFVRLITCIGPAPGCALGNGCNKRGGPCNFCGLTGGGIGTVGSVTDIPLDKIASVVHNAV